MKPTSCFLDFTAGEPEASDFRLLEFLSTLALGDVRGVDLRDGTAIDTDFSFGESASVDSTWGFLGLSDAG